MITKDLIWKLLVLGLPVSSSVRRKDSEAGEALRIGGNRSFYFGTIGLSHCFLGNPEKVSNSRDASV